MKTLILFLLITVTSFAQTTPFQSGQTSQFVNGTVTRFYVAPPSGGGAFVRSGLIGEWIFNTDGTDTSGSGNNLTLVGSPTFSGGTSGITLNGSSQWASTTATTYDFTSSNFTIQFWAYINATGSQQFIQYGNNTGYEFNIDGGGNLNFITWNAGPAFQQSVSSVPPIATYCNIAVVRSGASVIIYINGVNSTLVSGTHINPLSASGSTLGIGRNGTFATGYLGGKLYDFFIYNRALSSTEVNNNYNNP